jgi:hypothetical protein
MAFATFVGTGIITGEFTIDGVIVSLPVIPGEYRLQKPFPYPTLDLWRREALVATSSIEAWDTRGRTTVLFAHESDMGSVFFDLTKTSPEELAGIYNFKRKANLADKDLAVVLKQKELALGELVQQAVPAGHIDLIRKRLESATFNHRVTGICAAVYLTALLLEEVEALS